jgi:hypothetical protein
MDLPSRILLAHQARTGPDLEQITRELDDLLGVGSRGDTD